MKKTKLLFSLVAVIIAIVAAVTALVMFRDELTAFFMDIAQKFEEKKKSVLKCCDSEDNEFTDYADV